MFVMFGVDVWNRRVVTAVEKAVLVELAKATVDDKRHFLDVLEDCRKEMVRV